MNDVQISTAGIAYPEWGGRLQAFVEAYLKRRGIDNWEVSILLCDDRVIKDLNRRYRNLDQATDVLSFSQLEPGPEFASGILEGSEHYGVRSPAGSGKQLDRRIAGDVVISLESLGPNLQEDVSEDREDVSEEELKRLLIHGLLHLEGWDHPEEAVGSEMWTIQEHLLKELNKERIF